MKESVFTLKFNERKSSSERRCRLSTRNREILCYGCQSSESNWTQKANVIYWCSVGPRSPKPGEHTGPKTHKWDIDRFEGGEGKKLYLTMKCLTYSIEWLTLSLCLSLSHSHLHTHYIQQRRDIQQCMFLWQPIKLPIGRWGWQHLKVFKWKEWSEL